MSSILQRCIVLSLLILSGGCFFAVAQEGTSLPRQDTATSFYLQNIVISGNKVTREKIILRELPVKKGDTIHLHDRDTIALRCKQQLANLSLFNSVRVNFFVDSAGATTLNIMVVERWYTWPLPIFQIADRNFNQWWITKDPNRLNYGVEFIQYNMRGRNETLRIKLQDGFTRKVEMAYTFPWIEKTQTIGASFKITYLQNKEIWYATRGNKLQFYRDPDKPMQERYTAMFTLRFRKQLYKTSLITFSFNNIQVGDTVISPALNYNYLLDGRKLQEAFSIAYTFIHDRRDYKYYPLSGRFTQFDIGHSGLGFSKHVNVAYVYISRNHYYKLAHRHYLSVGGKAKITFPEKQAYNFYRALGYADFIRGYEYYVIDGQHFFLAKLNYSYCIFSREMHYDFIPFPRIKHIPFSVYASVFNDWGYAVNEMYKATNSYANSILYGAGCGLNFVAFYDKVFRAEVAINKQGRAGLYLHLQYPL